jgi:hypothetical protein
MLPPVPGIIEAWMMVTPNPDGRVSFRVLIGTGDADGGPDDLIELIISPEHIRRALADAKIRALATAGFETEEKEKEVQTFPCHVGFSRVTP